MRDNIAFLLRGAAEDWKKKNNRPLYTFELNVYSALTEAAAAIDELQKIIVNQDMIINNQDTIIHNLNVLIDGQRETIHSWATQWKSFRGE